MIDDRIIELLKKYPPSWIQISIDGDRDAHNQIRGKNSFEKAVSGIKRLKRMV